MFYPPPPLSTRFPHCQPPPPLPPTTNLTPAPRASSFWQGQQGKRPANDSSEDLGSSADEDEATQKDLLFYAKNDGKHDPTDRAEDNDSEDLLQYYTSKADEDEAETERHDHNPKEAKEKEAPPPPSSPPPSSPPPQKKAASPQPQLRKLNLRNSPGKKGDLLLPADRTAANKTWLDNGAVNKTNVIVRDRKRASSQRPTGPSAAKSPPKTRARK